jgi:hypothetical protein
MTIYDDAKSGEVHPAITLVMRGIAEKSKHPNMVRVYGHSGGGVGIA